MKEFLRKQDYILPLIASVLFFFTQRDYFPSFIYTLLIVIFGFYFFPVKNILLFFDTDSQLKSRKIDFISLFANFVLSILLVISIPLLYLHENESINLIIKILSLINFSFLIYFYFKDHNNKRSIIHLCFVFFTAILIG